MHIYIPCLLSGPLQISIRIQRRLVLSICSVRRPPLHQAHEKQEKMEKVRKDIIYMYMRIAFPEGRNCQKENNRLDIFLFLLLFFFYITFASIILY